MGAQTRWLNRLALGHFDALVPVLDCQAAPVRETAIFREVPTGDGQKVCSNPDVEDVFLRNIRGIPRSARSHQAHARGIDGKIHSFP